jgi:hypothetical protein
MYIRACTQTKKYKLCGFSPQANYTERANAACRRRFFFLNRLVGGGVQLGPLGAAATDWPIIASAG